MHSIQWLYPESHRCFIFITITQKMHLMNTLCYRPNLILLLLLWTSSSSLSFCDSVLYSLSDPRADKNPENHTWNKHPRAPALTFVAPDPCMTSNKLTFSVFSTGGKCDHVMSARLKDIHKGESAFYSSLVSALCVMFKSRANSGSARWESSQSCGDLV